MQADALTVAMLTLIILLLWNFSFFVVGRRRADGILTLRIGLLSDQRSRFVALHGTFYALGSFRVYRRTTMTNDFNRPGPDLRTTPTTERRSPWTMWIGIAVVVLIIALAAIYWPRRSETPATPPAGETTTTTPPATSTAPATPPASESAPATPPAATPPATEPAPATPPATPATPPANPPAQQ